MDEENIWVLLTIQINGKQMQVTEEISSNK